MATSARRQRPTARSSLETRRVRSSSAACEQGGASCSSRIDRPPIDWPHTVIWVRTGRLCAVADVTFGVAGGYVCCASRSSDYIAMNSGTGAALSRLWRSLTHAFICCGGCVQWFVTCIVRVLVVRLVRLEHRARVPHFSGDPKRVVRRPHLGLISDYSL